MSLIISFITLIILLFLSLKQFKKVIGISVVSIFLLSFSFYQILPIILFNLGGYPIGTTFLSEKTLIKAYFFSIIGLASFFLGFLTPFKFIKKYKLRNISNKTKNISLLIFFIGLMLFFSGIFLLDIEKNFNKNFITVGIFMIIGSTLIFFYWMLLKTKSNIRDKIVFVFLFIFSFSLLLETGNRRMVLGFILFMIQLYLLQKKKKVRGTYLLLFIPITLFSIILIRAFRTALLEENDLFNMTIYYFKIGFSDIRFFSSAIDSPTCFFFFGRILEEVPHHVPYIYWRSYYRVFYFIIPRSFWPDKPLKLTQTLGTTFWPSFTSSTGATLVGESFYNFGLVGIVIVFFLWGLIVKQLESKIKLKDPNLNMNEIFLISFFTAWIPDIFRGGGFSSSFSGQILTFGLPLLVLLFFSLLPSKN